MLNFPILWPFSIFYVLLRTRRQNFQKLNNFKGVYVTWREADQISWPFVKRDFDMLRILNLPLVHNHNPLRLERKSDCKPL